MKRNTGRIVSLVPARGGSKGVPNKNLRTVGDRSLVALAVAAGALADGVESVIVTTDSEKIAEEGRRFGASVPFLRPEAISKDGSTDREFFRHYFDFLLESGASLPELVLHLRPTTPLRDMEVVNRALRTMLENPEATSLRSMSATRHTPYKMFSMREGYAEPLVTLDGVAESANLPRQDLPAAYIPNGYIDIVRPKLLLETDRLHGERMILFETDSIPDIDSYDDLERAGARAGEARFRRLLEYLDRKEADAAS